MNDTGQCGGFGLALVLLVLFITLKLVGVIAWSWVWVLAPLWISFSLFFTLFVLDYIGNTW